MNDVFRGEVRELPVDFYEQRRERVYEVFPFFLGEAVDGLCARYEMSGMRIVFGSEMTYRVA